LFSWLEDVRYALRVLGRQPGFTASAVLLLALGIGVNSAIFSIVDSVLLKPLPYPQPERLFNVWTRNVIKNRPQGAFSAPEFLDYARAQHSFSQFSAHMVYSVTLTGRGEPSRVSSRMVSPGFFEMLGVQPMRGRLFAAEEYQPGRNQVVVLSEEYWRQRFGADPAILGQTIRLDDELHLVAGIVPRQRGEILVPDLYIPLTFSPELLGTRTSRFLYVTGRLQEGASEQRAAAELSSIGRRVAEEHPRASAGWEPYLVPAQVQAQGEAKQPLVVLSMAVGLVLLVTCSNLANLLLVRAAGRQKEVAVRTALGASPWRVFRQMVTESVTLGLLGGVAGLGVSWWGVRAIAQWSPLNMPRLKDAGLDASAVAFTFLISLAAGLIFGMAPAWQMLRLNLAQSLREETRGGTGGRGRSVARSLLVTAEVAVSVILLVSAGLLVRTFAALGRLDLGFQSERVLTLRTTLPDTRYPSDEARAQYVKRALERVAAAPGVESATAATALPMMQVNWNAEFAIEGRSGEETQRETVSYVAVTPGYFETIGAGVRRGRGFTPTDDLAAPPVVLISEALEKRYFKGESAIGQHLKMTVGHKEMRAEVVGVARDIAQMRPEEAPRAVIYQPHAQRPWPFLAFAVKVRGTPAAYEGAVRRAFYETDPELPMERVMPLGALLERVLAQQRLAMVLLLIFSALAVVLAMVGLYGVLQMAVAQRSREIGIRMALGAGTGDVLRLVLGQGLGLTVAGVAAGLAVAPLTSRMMKQMIYGVEPLDPATFASVGGLVALFALLASAVPAWRATGVDPGRALRAD